MNEIKINIWIANVSAYAQGKLIGEWVELPTTPEHLDEVRHRIGGEEQAIYDVDTELNVSIGEYTNIYELNELLNSIDDLEIVAAYLEAYGGTLAEAVAAAPNCSIYTDYDDVEDLAYDLVDQGLYGQIPQAIACYIDYQAIAKDLEIEGYCETSHGIICH